MRQDPQARRKTFLRRLRRAALALVVAGAGCGVLLYSMASYTPPLPPPPAVPPQQAEQAVQQVQQQVQAVRRYSQARVQAPYRIQVRSDDLNSYLAQHVPEAGGLPSGIESIHDIRVNFEGGRIIVTGYVKAWGREMHTTVAGRVLPDGAGGLRFEPDEMLVGKLPMPARMRQEAAQRIQQELRKSVADMGASVSAIETSSGSMVIQGMTADPARAQP